MTARARSNVVRDNPAMSPPPRAMPDPLVHKGRTGLIRVWYAVGHSLAGLRDGWSEPAFRQEALAAIVMIPASFWLARSWVEAALLSGSVLIVLIVELLNTAVEAAVDRIGAEWHLLAKSAKDLGSAAVLLSLLLCTGIWMAALWQRFGA